MAKQTKISETITENIFREHHGAKVFLEKSAIPNEYGFRSKNGTDYKGYPDFFKDEDEYVIVVEAKATEHENAEEEVQFYMGTNSITKDIVGIAISGQNTKDLKFSYFHKYLNDSEIHKIPNVADVLLSIADVGKLFKKHKYGEAVSAESLIAVLNALNNRLHKDAIVRASDRSLFFSGLMIALNSHNFRTTYKSMQAPSMEDISTTQAVVLESHNLNNAIIGAISTQLSSKINSLSKEFSWKDKFSFFKNIDYPIVEYKSIISKIETEIFKPFKNDEKQDILGRAYKIFLSRAGKAETKNIILTPDHIKELMVKLARLSVDDVVLDTCTGPGGFLMESMETMIRLSKGDTSKIENIKEKQLIGFEIDSVLFALACSNMFLHGDGKTNLLYRSSLLNESQGGVINGSDKDLLGYIRKLKPTKVIINPPYENNSSIKFAIQALEYLEANGRLIIIMPTPTLTQNQGGMTESLLKMAKLDFVIKMPSSLFSEQKRSVNTSIFGFTKTPHNETDEVLFYNMEDDGLVSIQHKGRIDKNKRWAGIEAAALDAITNSKENAGFCVKKKIYQDGKLNCAGVQLKNNSKSGYEMVKIKDIFNIEDGGLASNECDDRGPYNFVTAAEEWKKHSTYSHDKPAIIYAVGAAGSLGRSHYVKEKFIASNLCLILTPNDSSRPINLEFYCHYLNAIRKRVVSDLADGTSKLTISKSDFSEYFIDYIPIKEQDDFVKKHSEKIKRAKNQLIKVERSALDSINKMV